MAANTSPSSTLLVTRASRDQRLWLTSRGRLPLRRQLTQNPTVNPVRIEPFHRIHLHAIPLHREGRWAPPCQARRAAVAHGLAFLHHVAHLHIEPAEMPVDRLQAI